MNLRPRDRRALAWLAVSALLGLVVRFWPANDGAVVVRPTGNPVTLAEARLARLREAAATVPAKEAVYKKVSADLAAREKGSSPLRPQHRPRPRLSRSFAALGSQRIHPSRFAPPSLIPSAPSAISTAKPACQFRSNAASTSW